jgi:hypothetical protein
MKDGTFTSSDLVKAARYTVSYNAQKDKAGVHMRIHRHGLDVSKWQRTTNYGYGLYAVP